MGLETVPFCVSGVLQALHVASGAAVFPVRVETSSGPLDRQEICPNFARSPASKTLLVHTASEPPCATTRW